MPQIVLVTGGAKRLGAAIAREFHAADYQVLIHYRSSEREVAALCRELNARRPNSSVYMQGDLLKTEALSAMIERAADIWGGLDVLVNNASAFYPTPFGQVTYAQWDELIGSNVRAPFFLSQAAAPHLRKRSGAIVNIGDIHAERTLKDYPVYSIAKAALHTMTRSLAKELAPEVRVNAVAPGAILWPEAASQPEEQRSILERIPLGRTGRPEDIARAVLFLAQSSPYITGQILAVDGGRTLFS
jgi:pteridine reductase